MTEPGPGTIVELKLSTGEYLLYKRLDITSVHRWAYQTNPWTKGLWCTWQAVLWDMEDADELNIYSLS